MEEQLRQEILSKAKTFFKEKIVTSHIKNTEKLTSLSKFNVNPFLVEYLANYLTGNSDPRSIAKALIYPRVLSTSITTTFGTQLQYFCNDVLSSFASLVNGIDIEFVDQIDKRRKYCQIKAGPNTINKDDVQSIEDHFTAAKNLARTNKLTDLGINDLVVGVFYGTESELSGHYKKIQKEHPVYIGRDFWFRLTGDSHFYGDLINVFGEAAKDEDSTGILEDVISKLATDIEAHYHEIIG